MGSLGHPVSIVFVFYVQQRETDSGAAIVTDVIFKIVILVRERTQESAKGIEEIFICAAVIPAADLDDRMGCITIKRGFLREQTLDLLTDALKGLLF